MDFKKTYPAKRDEQQPVAGFIPLAVSEEHVPHGWQVSQMTLVSPAGDTIEIKSSNMMVVAELLRKMA